MTRGGRLISVRGAVSVLSLTIGDGPFLFGLSDKALSVTEVAEFLNVNGPTTPDQVPQKEHSARGSIVRTLGIIRPSGNGAQASLYLDNRSLSGMKFSEEATGWNYWIMNLGINLTSGASMFVAGQLFVEFNASG